MLTYVVQREQTASRWSERLKSRDIATVRAKRLASVQVGNDERVLERMLTYADIR
jgi:hypothetical protein